MSSDYRDDTTSFFRCARPLGLPLRMWPPVAVADDYGAAACTSRSEEGSRVLVVTRRPPPRDVLKAFTHAQCIATLSHPTRRDADSNFFVSSPAPEAVVDAQSTKFLIIRIQINELAAEIFATRESATALTRVRTREMMARVSRCCFDSRKSPRKYPMGVMLQQSR